MSQRARSRSRSRPAIHHAGIAVFPPMPPKNSRERTNITSTSDYFASQAKPIPSNSNRVLTHHRPNPTALMSKPADPRLQQNSGKNNEINRQERIPIRRNPGGNGGIKTAFTANNNTRKPLSTTSTPNALFKRLFKRPNPSPHSESDEKDVDDQDERPTIPYPYSNYANVSTRTRSKTPNRNQNASFDPSQNYQKRPRISISGRSPSPQAQSSRTNSIPVQNNTPPPSDFVKRQKLIEKFYKKKMKVDKLIGEIEKERAMVAFGMQKILADRDRR